MFNTRIEFANRQIGRLLLASLAVLTLVTIVTGLLYQRYPGSPRIVDCSGYGGSPAYTYKLKFDNPEVAERKCREHIPVLRISVKNRDYISLQRKRLEALDKGVLITSGSDLLPAHLSFQGDILQGKIRLKGDWTDHLLEPKSWSLRVVLSDDYHVLGRREFSLQTPQRRANDIEYLYTSQLRQAGLIPLRSKLVYLEFNGEDWGLMTLEDHFTKELMESHGRKESVILKFDESAMWDHRVTSESDFGPYDNVYVSDYAAFDSKRIRKSDALSKYYTSATSLMAAWQDGRIPLHQLVDLKKFADFIIVNEAWGAWHSYRWHNLRFYFNPYLMKFEPVPYDNGLPLMDVSRFTYYMSAVKNDSAHALKRPPISELFMQEDMSPLVLGRLPSLKEKLVDSPAFLDLKSESQFLSRVFEKEKMKKNVRLDLLKRNYKFLLDEGEEYFSPGVVPKNMPADLEQRQYSTMLRINHYKNGIVTLANRMPFHIVVKEIRLVSRSGYANTVRTNVKLPLELSETPFDQRPTIYQLILDTPEESEFENMKLEIVVENPVTGQIITELQDEQIAYYTESTYLAISPTEKVPGEPASFVQINDKGWVIPAGNWYADRPIIVPQGISLAIAAGATVTFSEDSYLLAREQLSIEGTAEQPVVLSGLENKTWRGIYLVNAELRSRWRHLHVSDVDSFRMDSFNLSGAVNVYDSDITIDTMKLSGVLAEDGLNVVKSNFQFSGLSLGETVSDGIDADFSTGSISNSHFYNIGGDAIDTSGSTVDAHDITMEYVHDKAFSAGEASVVRVTDTTIKQVGVGVAAKDYSFVELSRLDITGAKVGVMSYSKKREYGGAHINADNVTILNSEKVVVNQLGSSITLDGVSITGRKVNIDYLYEEGFMRK